MTRATAAEADSKRLDGLIEAMKEVKNGGRWTIDGPRWDGPSGWGLCAYDPDDRVTRYPVCKTEREAIDAALAAIKESAGGEE